MTETEAMPYAEPNYSNSACWVEELQAIELNREVAGTSRIEGAEFTEQELDAAIAAASPAELVTRSQRQARAAVRTYRWIASIPDDRPADADLIREIHRLIVLGAIRIWRDDSGKIMIGVRLEWPTEITETDFFRK